MDLAQDNVAWMTKDDGVTVYGEGPFTSSAEMPEGETCFYIQDFELGDPEPWKIPARVHRSIRSETIKQSSGTLEISWQPLDAAPFSMVFQEIMSAIQGGIFEKTVPVVTETGHTSVNPANFFREALTTHPLPLRSYGWAQGHSGFAGATPERLFRLDNNQLQTMALAGTAKQEDRDVFAVDEKEIREHEYVAQTLVSKLLDLGKTSRSPRQILDLGPIVHFLTNIDLHLDHPADPRSLLRRLHPTPALGPLPRTPETTALLKGWRERLGCPPTFGAPFGLYDQGEFDAVVAIRGAWWDDKTVSLPAGCGIIEASRLVNEWRELRLKRDSVKRLLNLHSY